MTSNRMLAVAAAVALASAPLAAQLPVGASTPEMEVKEWFKPPSEGTTLEELRGRVVFVEFWATW